MITPTALGQKLWSYHKTAGDDGLFIGIALVARRLSVVACLVLAMCPAAQASQADLSPWVPGVLLNGPNPLTNECHANFTDPGATGIGLPPAPPLAISAGAYHSLALMTNGTVVGWGLNEFGEANPPASATNVVAISAGGYQSLALRADRSVVFWGLHGGGIVVPESETDIAAIAAGYGFSLVLRTNGTVAGWGEFYYDRFYPVTIPENVTNVVAIAAGYAHALALKADGTVLGWGDDTYGQTTIPANATNVVAISAGAAHSLALKTDGSVIAWGITNFGRLDVPVDATNIVAIAAGGLHSLALSADGHVFAWGWDAAGQTDIPLDATNVVAITAGYYDCLVKIASGLVIGWGGNYYGQRTIPDEINTNYLPVTVSGSVNVDVPGTSTLTYTSSNSVGGVGQAIRSVVVVDTTPPDLVCPPDLTLEFTRPTGVTASFLAQATDLCSGPVQTSFIPPSGNTFAIGTNTVMCYAADDSGNSNQCTFSVIVLGPRGVCRNVLAEIIALRSTLPQRWIPRMDLAIANLSIAVSPALWVDETHLGLRTGKNVFAAEERAVIQLSLLSAVRNSPVSKSIAKDWSNRLAKAMRQIALVEIEAATTAGATTNQLKFAPGELSNGDQAVAQQKYLSAIQHYQDAWKGAEDLFVPLTK